MKLYGTTTSPFVRRVRIVAAELGEPIDRVDTAPEAGMAALREVSPIRKVPVAVIDGRTLFDSRVIIDWLVTTRGWFGGGGDLTPMRLETPEAQEDAATFHAAYRAACDRHAGGGGPGA